MFPCPAPRLLLGQPAPLGSHFLTTFVQNFRKALSACSHSSSVSSASASSFSSSALSDQRPALVGNEMGDIAAWEVVRDTATVCSDVSFGDLHVEPLQDAPFFATRLFRRRRLWRRLLFAGIAWLPSGASIGALERARYRAFTGSRVGLEGFQALWAVGGVLLFLLGWVT